VAKKHVPITEVQAEKQTQETIHKYYIIVLGASGAGKTVYLASMYNRLMVQDDQIGFYLSTNRQDRRELVARYESLKNHQWPSGTRYSEMREWNFACQVPSSNEKPYTAMEFVYLDYPGEGLTSIPADPMAIEQLDKRINEADALLGIIDGHKVLAALSKIPLPFATSLNQDLGNILPELQDRSTPVQFIITKWDLLANRGYSMPQVIEYLMTIPPFRTYITSCQRNRIPVRTVPLSSVGMNYAQLNDDGEMIPKEVGELEPCYTEMPLACVLFDQIEMRLQRLKEEEEKKRRDSINVKPSWTFGDMFKKGTGQTLTALHSLLPDKFQWGEKFVQKINDALEAPYDNKVRESIELERQLQQEKEASLKAIQDQQTAVDHVLQSMKYLRFQLEKEYPASVLSSNHSGSTGNHI
jgi:hypothetical protein